jgi:hypothetical protein
MATAIVAGVLRDFLELFATTPETVNRARSTIVTPDMIRLRMNLLLVLL